VDERIGDQGMVWHAGEWEIVFVANRSYGIVARAIARSPWRSCRS
jgi:hypothetical protein